MYVHTCTYMYTHYDFFCLNFTAKFFKSFTHPQEIISKEDPRYILTNTTLQFTSYVEDLLTSLSFTPVDYPSLTPLQPIEPSWIRNDESITLMCGVCDLEYRNDHAHDNDLDGIDDPGNQEGDNDCQPLATHSFDIQTLYRKFLMPRLKAWYN